MDLNEDIDDKEKGIDEEKIIDEINGSGPFTRLLDQANYITKSLDNTITTLLQLKEGIQDMSVKIKQNQETLAKSIETLKDKVKNIATHNAAIVNNKRTSKNLVNDKDYSLNERVEGSRISQVEDENVKGKDSFKAT